MLHRPVETATNNGHSVQKRGQIAIFANIRNNSDLTSLIAIALTPNIKNYVSFDPFNFWHQQHQGTLSPLFSMTLYIMRDLP